MKSSEPNSRRKPKGDKRARTRARLFEAARELIRERGHEQTTLRDIASRAGMTSGAIYGNFRSKDDLFIAMAHEYWPPIAPKVRAGSSFAEKMRAMAEAILDALPERRLAARGRLTGMAYALDHAEMQARVQEITAASYEFGARWIREVADERELPMPPEILVRVIHALTEGLVFQRLLTPDLIPDQVFYAAFARLALTPSGDTSPSARRAIRTPPSEASA